MQIVEHGPRRKLENCPVGLFKHNDTIALKTEYGVDSYIVSSGEVFIGGAKSASEIGKVIVQPLKIIE